MFWRKIFIILLLTFFISPNTVFAVTDEQLNAPEEYAEQLENAKAQAEASLFTTCVNGDQCKQVDKACNQDSDCKGYSIKDGGEKCLKNKCFLDAIGQEKFNKNVSILGLTDLKADLQIKKPLLNIRIPGLSFSDLASSTVTEENGKVYLNIPYIAEYISAAYKVGLVVISIIAAAMIIITGVKIIVGGGQEQSEGFRRIGQIAIGLFIGWGSYTILNIVNPNLTSFNALRVEYIKTIPEPVIDFGDSTDFDNADPQAPYEFKYFKEDKCPIELTNQIFCKDNAFHIDGKECSSETGNIWKNVPRRVEFHEKVIANPNLISGSLSERVQKAVELTARCKIHYENCGVATTNMYALAATKGSKADECLKNSDPGHTYGKSTTSFGFCNVLGNNFGNIKKQTIHDAFGIKTPYGTVKTLLNGLWCGSVKKCGSNIGWKESCIGSKTEAANRLKSILQDTGKWSPNWVNDLQPGDYYIVINWNSSCNAAHSAMFMGWADKASGVAYVEKADAGKFLRIGSVQFGGDDVVLGIYRPK